MPRYRKQSPRVSPRGLSFQLDLPKTLLQSCLELESGDQLHMSGRITGGSDHDEVQVTGSMSGNVMSYVFNGHKNTLRDFLKQTWTCDISAAVDTPEPARTRDLKRRSETPANSTPGKRPRGRPRKCPTGTTTVQSNRKDESELVASDTESSFISKSCATASETSVDDNENTSSNEDSTLFDALPRMDELHPIKLEVLESEDLQKEMVEDASDEFLSNMKLGTSIPEEQSEDTSQTTENDEDKLDISEKKDEVILVKSEDVDRIKFRNCPVCDKKFRRPGLLRSHLRRIHNISSPSSEGKGPRIANDDLLQQNHTACQKLGLLKENDEMGSAAICIICHKKFKGASFQRACFRHWHDKHRISIKIYTSLLKMEPEEQSHAVDKILQEEKLISKDSKEGISGKSSPSQLVQCPGCRQYYSGFSNLVIHIKMQHKTQSDYKTILSQLEDLKSQFHEDGIKNRDDYLVACRYCKVQRFGRGLIKHLKLVHSDEPDISDAISEATVQCRELLRQRESLRKKGLYQQEKLHKVMYYCSLCNKKFTSRAARTRHQKFTCKDNPDRLKDWISCTCCRRFPSVEQLEQHKPKCLRCIRTVAVCDLCGKSFKHESGLYTHKSKAHFNIVRYKCEQCGKGFYDKSAHDAHASIHTHDRNFLCDICGKSFKNMFSVHKHKRTVHQNRYTYHCPKCGHGVQKQQYLNSHVCGRVRRIQAGEADAKPSTLDSSNNIIIPTVASLLPSSVVAEQSGPVIYQVDNENVQIMEVPSEVWSTTDGALATHEYVIEQQPAGYIEQYPQQQHGSL